MAVKRTYVKQQMRQGPVPISPEQASKRREEIAQKEEYLESLRTGKTLSDGTAGMQVNDVNISALEKQIAREKKALEYLAPREGTDREKDEAKKKYDEAAAYIRENALTLAEVGKYPKPGDPEKDADYGKAVEKSINCEVGNPKFQQMCEQLKRAAAVLDPENPDLRNINRHRQER